MGSVADKYRARLSGGGETKAPESTGSVADKYRARLTGPKAPVAAAVEAPQPEAEYDRNWYDAPRAALQGLTMGTSDEIGAGIAAGAAKLIDGADFTDTYAENMQSLQDERKAYETAHPAEAIALNLAGGLATGGAGAAKSGASIGTKLATAGATGTLAGGASGDIGNRTQTAGAGGVLSTALSALPIAGRPLANAVSKRRMVQDVGDIPINMMDDPGILPGFYQKVVGKAWGGEKLMEQSKKVLDKATQRKDVLGRAAARMTERGKEATRGAKELLTDTTSAQKAAAGLEKDEIVGAAQQAGRALTETTNANFREQVYDAALPAGITDDVVAQIRTMAPAQRNAVLNDIWTKEGFKSVKAQDFNIDEDKIYATIAKRLDDPALEDSLGGIRKVLGNKLGGKLARDVEKTGFSGDIVPKQLTRELSTGKIAGDDLLEARNAFRRQANKLGDDGDSALRKEALAVAADTIDDTIADSFKAAGRQDLLDDFIAEKDAWGNMLGAINATDKASAKKAGLFDADDWLATQSGRRGMGRGKLQDLAQDTQKGLNKAGETLADTTQEAQTALSRTKLALANRARTEGRALSAKDREGYVPDRLTKALGDASEEVKLRESQMPKYQGNLDRAFATGMLATPLTGALGIGAGMASLPIGYGVAKTLASKTGQKMAAGQTAPQKAIAEILRQYDAGPASKILQDLGRGSIRGGIVAGSGE